MGGKRALIRAGFRALQARNRPVGFRPRAYGGRTYPCFIQLPNFFSGGGDRAVRLVLPQDASAFTLQSAF